MVEAGSNTATGVPVVSSPTLHQVTWHFHESLGTSRCLSSRFTVRWRSINRRGRSSFDGPGWLTEGILAARGHPRLTQTHGRRR
jgi:hypothetical protein